jgi:hypothetical protein
LGSFFTIYPIRISLSKITSHSLRPIPVEGEYRLFTNDLRIRREIAPGVADKICAASLFVELPPRLFDSILDTPGTSFNKAFLSSRLERLLAFSTDAIGLPPRTEISWAGIIEVPSRDISSNLSMSGHNSLMLGLESPDITAIISTSWELAPEEKGINHKN